MIDYFRIEQLDVEEQDVILTKFRGAETNSLREQNEFLMMLLRAHCEMKQGRHVHDTAENRYTNTVNKLTLFNISRFPDPSSWTNTWEAARSSWKPRNLWRTPLRRWNARLRETILDLLWERWVCLFPVRSARLVWFDCLVIYCERWRFVGVFAELKSRWARTSRYEVEILYNRFGEWKGVSVSCQGAHEAWSIAWTEYWSCAGKGTQVTYDGYVSQ